VLRSISVPAGNERGPLFMDQVLAAIHQGNVGRLPVTLAVARHLGEVTLCCRFPAELRGLVEGQLYAQYPDVKITSMPEDAFDPAPAAEVWSADLHLSHDLFPIKRYVQFEDAMSRQSADPLTAILTAVAGTDDHSPIVELTVLPAPKRRAARSRRCAHRLARPFFRTHHRIAKLFLEMSLSHSRLLRSLGWTIGRLARQGAPAELRPLETSGSRQHDREEDLQTASDKMGKPLFETSLCIRVVGKNADDARRRLREIAGAFGQFNSRHAAFHLRHAATSGPISCGE
jgi:hypothetical protein